MKDEEGIIKIWMSEVGRELERLTLLIKELLEINRIKAGNLQYCAIIPARQVAVYQRLLQLCQRK